MTAFGILSRGEVSEWLMVPLSKSGVRKHRGYESLPLRQHSYRGTGRRDPTGPDVSGRGRLVDYGAALEMRFGATRRGFESRPLRHTGRDLDAHGCVPSSAHSLADDSSPLPRVLAGALPRTPMPQPATTPRTLKPRARSRVLPPGPCPLERTQHQIAIDVETGELLLQILGGDIVPCGLCDPAEYRPMS